jgi:hypothetical protein
VESSRDRSLKTVRSMARQKQARQGATRETCGSSLRATEDFECSRMHGSLVPGWRWRTVSSGSRFACAQVWRALCQLPRTPVRRPICYPSRRNSRFATFPVSECVVCHFIKRPGLTFPGHIDDSIFGCSGGSGENAKGHETWRPPSWETKRLSSLD